MPQFTQIRLTSVECWLSKSRKYHSW